MIPWQSALAWLVTTAAEHGLMLLAGVTCWLVLGTAAVALARSPIHQVRLGELVLLLALAWLGLALAPLDRPAGVDRWLPGVMRAQPLAVEPSTPAAVRPEVDRERSPAADEGAMVEETPDVVARSQPASPSAATKPASGAIMAAPERRATEHLSRREPRPAQVVHPVRAVPAGEAREQPSAVAARPAGPLPLPTDEQAPAPGAVARRAIDPPSPQPWIEALASDMALLWLGGAAACIGWLALGRVVLARWLWQAQPADGWLARLYAALPWPEARALPRLLVSPRYGRPIACGLLRPTILLPAECCRQDRSAQLRHVLLHELGHVRQRDAWGQALFNLLLPLLWFHPLYWWLRGRVHLCRELLADDWAASQSNKESYARELIALIKSRGPRHDLGVGVLGVFQSSTEFYRRMTMLLERSGPLASCCSWWWRVGALTVGAVAVVLFTATLGLSAPDQGDDSDAAASAAASEASQDEAATDEGRDEESADADREAAAEAVDSREDGDEERGEAEQAGEGDEPSESATAEGEGQPAEDAAAEAPMTDEEESALAELQQRREALAQELNDLEARINETSQSREQRLAQQQWLAEQEAKQHELQETEARIRESVRIDAEELEQRIFVRQSEVLAGVLETVNRLADEQQRLQESLSTVTAQVDELREQRDALAAEVAELREALSQARPETP